MNKEFDFNLESSKALFNNATVGILAVNGEGNIIMANGHLLKQFGYDITAFVGIYLEKSSLYDTVAKELMNIPEIVRLNYITGNYSMFIEIVCKDITELRYVLHDALQKIKGIDRTETFISLEEGFNRNVQVAQVK